MPPRLTPNWAQNEPQLSSRMKWATNDRNMPTQKTWRDCWPHLISGSKIFHSSPFQSLCTKRVTKNAMITK